MTWWKFWERETRGPSPATIAAKEETEQARQRLVRINRDDIKLNALTERMTARAEENNFAADIRRALGAR